MIMRTFRIGKKLFHIMFQVSVYDVAPSYADTRAKAMKQSGRVDRIYLIKAYRTLTGAGLKECAAIVDMWLGGSDEWTP